MHLERRPCAPVTDQHAGIDQRCLDVLRQRIALRFGQAWHDVRNDHVKARQNNVLRVNAIQLAIADVGNFRRTAAISDIHAGGI